MPVSWPITREDLRAALGYEADEGDDADLDLWALAASQAVDRHTGRHLDPTRHLVRVPGAGPEVDPTVLPAVFVIAARETGKDWWRLMFDHQDSGEVPNMDELPEIACGLLKGYPPAPGIA